MSRRVIACLALLGAVVALSPSARADFATVLDFAKPDGSALPAMVDPAVNSTVDIAISAVQTYGTGGSLGVINLNFTSSSAGLNVGSTGTWTWDPVIALAPSSFFDPLAPDAIVNWSTIAPITPASFKVGTLQIQVPAFIPGGSNTYKVSILGGTFEDGDETHFLGGLAYASRSYGGLSGDGEYTFVVTPEPATMALLGLGSLVMFIRRRSR